MSGAVLVAVAAAAGNLLQGWDNATIGNLLQGWDNATIVVRFLSPLSAVPLVTLVGLGLYARGFPLLAECVEIGLPELILLVLFSQYVPYWYKSKWLDRFAVLISVALVWAYASLLTGAYKNRPPNTQFSCRVNRSGLVGDASWFATSFCPTHVILGTGG